MYCIYAIVPFFPLILIPVLQCCHFMIPWLNAGVAIRRAGTFPNGPLHKLGWWLHLKKIKHQQETEQASEVQRDILC